MVDGVVYFMQLEPDGGPGSIQQALGRGVSLAAADVEGDVVHRPGMRARFQTPGVQVVALVPVAGPVPPPIPGDALARRLVGCWGR
jgi:hypothetical protein